MGTPQHERRNLNGQRLPGQGAFRWTAGLGVTALSLVVALSSSSPTFAAPVRESGSAAEPTAASAPAPEPASTATGAARAKGLKVVVKRPAEAASLVKVTIKGPKQKRTGKKFSRTVRRTTTFANLKPGLYRITATTITLRDQRIVPTVTKKKVRIPRSRARRTTTVTYAAPVFCERGGTRLWAWGDNDAGQLGRTGRVLSSTPVLNPFLRAATDVTGGSRHAVARCHDGTVWSWGQNVNGELGLGHTQPRVHPVKVPGLTKAIALASGVRTSYALRADGTVWAWGGGRYGELGNGTSGVGRVATRPVKVNLPAKATAIAAGGYTAYAVLEDGSVAVWGNTEAGQRGDGTVALATATPVRVVLPSPALRITAGHGTVLVSTATGTWGWGLASQAQLGVPGELAVKTPKLLNAEGHGLVGATGYASFLILTDGVTSFGSGRHHDVGRDTGGSPSVAGPLALGGLEPEAIVGKGYTGYALSSTGVLWSWGDHSRGQVGRPVPRNGSLHSLGILPGQVIVPGGVRGVGAGNLNGYAISN